MAASRLPTQPHLPPQRRPEPRGPVRRAFTVVAVLGVAVAGAGIYYFRYGWPIRPPPPPPPEVTSAHFTLIEGLVKVKAMSTLDWREADNRMPLGAGDLIRTWPRSLAEITFVDRNVVRLSPESLMTIEGDPERIEYVMSSGVLNLRTGAKGRAGQSTTVGMPSGRGVVAPSSEADFTVGSGYSDVSVTEGQVDLETAAGDRLKVASSEGVRIDASGRAGPKMRLPGMPDLVAPARQSRIYVSPNALTRFEWRAVRDASGYRFMLARSAGFAAPVADSKELTRTSVEVQGLEPGEYFWRVSALGLNGVSGRFSTAARFTVVRPTASAPDLVLSSVQLHANILQVKGKTEPGATVTINGQRLRVEPDGSFSDFVALTEAGNQEVVIRSKGLDTDRFTEKKVTVNVRPEG